MLILLSPSKTMAKKNYGDGVSPTQPEFLEVAKMLMEKLNELDSDSLVELFGVSQKLAVVSRAMFTNWDMAKGWPAGWAYSGETFSGLGADSMSVKDIEYANEHLRVMSGLYGLLKITDEVKPYRLEIQTKLAGEWGSDLYALWSEQLLQKTKELSGGQVLGLASNEYLKTLRKQKRVRLIEPKFKYRPGAKDRSKNAFPKYSRGLMASWVIKNRIADIEQIKEFDLEGFEFSEEDSTELNPVFYAPSSFTIKGRFKKS